MTDSEIVKGLECCGTTKGCCHDCPLNDIEDIQICQDELVTEAYRLINRQQAEIKRLDDWVKIQAGQIVELTNANNEPVKHGHWYNRGGRFRCSVCDTKAYLKDVGGTGGWSHEYIQQKSPYCPNCGAKMDGEEVQE